MFTLGRGRPAPYAAATASHKVRPENTSRPFTARACATKWFTELDCVARTTLWWPCCSRKLTGVDRLTVRMFPT